MCENSSISTSEKTDEVSKTNEGTNEKDLEDLEVQSISGSTTLHQRKKAFDLLQKLAFQVRRDVNLLNCDENPHEYLERIHESQNDEFKSSNIKVTEPKSNDQASIKKRNTPDASLEVNTSFVCKSQASPMTVRSQKQISFEIIKGLDSILKDFDRSCKSKKSIKKRSFKKRRGVKAQFLTVANI